jgi:tetratricopeptide (TPR) repeat protein
MPPDAGGERLWQLQRALSLDPGNAEAALDTANLLLTDGRFEEALAISRRALATIESISVDETDDDIATELSDVKLEFMSISYRSLIGLGRLEEAHSIIRDILEFSPDDEEALLDRAWIELQLGLSDSAMEHVQEFIDAHPESELIPAAKTALAQGYLEQGQYREAIETASGLAESGSEFPGLQMILGEAYYRAGDFPDAIEHLTLALPESPDPQRVQFLLGDAYMRDSRPREAAEQFRAIIERNPSCFRAHMELGDAYFAMEMMDEAREQYFAAMQIRPDSAEARNALDRVGE